MAASTTTTRPTPERIFNTMIAFQETEALKAAIELDIFTAIAEGADTAASLAAKTRAAERGVRILCDYFTVKELLTKKGERYALTQESAVFLNRHSPACLATMIDFLASPQGMRPQHDTEGSPRMMHTSRLVWSESGSPRNPR